MAIINYAQSAFASNGRGPMEFIPRQKFNFTVEIEVRNGNTLLFDRVQSITMPGYDIDSAILNQYNKKRVVQTKLNYGSANIAFYDTFDNEFQLFMKSYLANYYNTNAGIHHPGDVDSNSTIDDNLETRMGFTPTSEDDRYFITEIRVKQVGIADRERVTYFKNPMITQIQNDTLSYDSSQPVIYNVTFQPESVTTEGVNERDGNWG